MGVDEEEGRALGEGRQRWEGLSEYSPGDPLGSRVEDEVVPELPDHDLVRVPESVPEVQPAKPREEAGRDVRGVVGGREPRVGPGQKRARAHEDHGGAEPVPEPQKHIAVPQLRDDQVKPPSGDDQRLYVGVGEGALEVGDLSVQERETVPEPGGNLRQRRELHLVVQDRLEALEADVRVVPGGRVAGEATDDGQAVSSGGESIEERLEEVEVALGDGGEDGQDPTGRRVVEEDDAEAKKDESTRERHTRRGKREDDSRQTTQSK